MHHVVGVTDDGRRLVDVVRDRLVVVARRAVGPFVGDGGVHVDGRPGRIAERVVAGAVLHVDTGRLDALRAAGRVTEPVDVDLDVAYADDAVVVVDKPSGMHVHPMGRHRDATLLGALLWREGARPDRPWGARRPLPGHRLDRATSGLVAFLTEVDAHAAFLASLSAGEVHRDYEALVAGRVRGNAGTVDAPLGRDPDLDYRRAVVPVPEGGRPAVTHWRVLRHVTDRTLLGVTLGTGRTHQVRAHLASIGHTIVGDDLYLRDAVDASSATDRIALRAVRLALPHPSTGDRLVVRTTGLDVSRW